jgi:hypothetical protein
MSVCHRRPFAVKYWRCSARGRHVAQALPRGAHLPHVFPHVFPHIFPHVDRHRASGGEPRDDVRVHAKV